MSDQQPGAPREPDAPTPPVTPPVTPPGAPPAAPPPAAPPEATTPVWPAHAQGESATSPPPPSPGYPAPGSPAPGSPAPGYPPPGYPPPGYPAGYPYAPVQTTSTMAIVGLVLAVASWILCPIVLAIVALILAKKSQDEIAVSGGRVGGEGLNTATKIVSWINIGLYAAVIVIFGAIFLIALVVGAASGT